MYKKAFLLMVLLLQLQITFSQLPKLTKNSTISVLTCATSTELYSAFGHTAFRVQDPKLGIDVVYNYGTFDPDKPNFYVNFALGDMQYSLSRRRFEDFLFTYELEKRWVKEQILNLTVDEKNDLFAFFEQNYLPENRDYAYDPLFNNCSTMVADILQNKFGAAIDLKDTHIEAPFTFRQLIMQHLNWNSWAAFGINVCYGAVVDRKASAEEHTFLPYYAMYQLRNASKDGKPLLLREREVLNYPEKQAQGYFPTTPLFWIVLLLLFTVAITYLDYVHQTRNKWLDFILFLVTGFMGIVLLFFWVGTAHSGTPNNLNVLWAFPLNLVVAFYLLGKKLTLWLPKYLWTVLGLMGLLLILWIFKVQILSPLFLLLMVTLGIRYCFLLFGKVSQ